MSMIEVLKFGSSVLRSPADLHVAVDEIYRRWRSGWRVLAVVSAFEGVTDRLMREVSDSLATDCPEATAAYLATGEQQTAALLLGSLRRYGLPSRVVDPREIGLMAAGSSLESTPVRVDRAALAELWATHPILILPGFYGVGAGGGLALFGRGGSDMSALFLAAELGAGCRLLKDVPGVFDADPARSAGAHRFTALSWPRAIEVAGRLIQPKALLYARSRNLAFEVGRPNELAGTAVGTDADRWASSTRPIKPLRLALVGCGIVGRGVYEILKRYPGRFEIRHVIVRKPDHYSGVDYLTTDVTRLHDPSVDVVVVCAGGVSTVHPIIVAALEADKFLVTANKAVIAAYGNSLYGRARGTHRRLWYSAAVGGALPALETLTSLQSPVREIRAIINSTCGVVLDEWVNGKTREQAIAAAQAAGFAEADPARDLNGHDSADKLALMIDAAFGRPIDPDTIPTRGIDSIAGSPANYRLIARATRMPGGITASVAPEVMPPGDFLGGARGPENRLEIELATGEVIRLTGQGAGRWPTAVSVLGDLHEIARIVEARPG